MAVFQVRTEQRSYQAVVQRGCVADVGSYLPSRVSKTFVVTTEDVWRLFKDRINQLSLGNPHILFLPHGEENKRLAAVETLADQLLELGADRSSLIIGFGGGIVTDIAGFLASIYMRGIPVIQAPTTLLAQVDAAVGGKTGVNLGGGKNLIGTFHQPIAVLIDPDLLSTLSARELRSGLFEILKCGVIRDADTYNILAEQSEKVLALDPALLDELISAAVLIKAEVVSDDEKEGDLRRILNFGHTIGHALEAETDYKYFLHGEAVAWGMIAATRLAVESGMLSASIADSIVATTHLYGPLPAAHHLSHDNLIARLSRDKKTIAGKVTFVLPTRIGSVSMCTDIPSDVIRKAMEQAFVAQG